MILTSTGAAPPPRACGPAHPARRASAATIQKLLAMFFPNSSPGFAAMAAGPCHRQLTMARKIAEGRSQKVEAAVRYLEDLKVGDKASFGSYAVTREEVLEFARKY